MFQLHFEDDDPVIVKARNCFCYDVVGRDPGFADGFGDVDCVDFLIVVLVVDWTHYGWNSLRRSLKAVSRHWRLRYFLSAEGVYSQKVCDV
jgi:hypothetical protein